MLTAYGAVAVTFMMVMYVLERRHRRYVLGFALGCLLSSSYGFLSGDLAFRGCRSRVVAHRPPALHDSPLRCSVSRVLLGRRGRRRSGRRRKRRQSPPRAR